jgi:hypothetical protein
VKATVIRVSMPLEKDVLELYQKKLNAFLSTEVEGKLPQVRFLAQSEYTPEKAAGLRAFSSIEPHITATIFWE